MKKYLSKSIYVDHEFINDLGELECQRVTKLEYGESGLRVDGGACRREKNLNLIS